MSGRAPSGTMSSGNRHAAIREQLASQQRVHVSDLATRLDVSEETIRRDLLALERAGEAVRVHGGAIVPAAIAAAAASATRSDSLDRLVSAAVERLPSVGSVFLGSGAVSLAIAETLPDASDRTIITSSIDIAMIAGTKPETVIYNLGGQVHHDVERADAQFGPWADELLTQLRFDAVVIEAPAIEPDGTVLAPTPHLAEQMRAAIACAERRVLVLTGATPTRGLAVGATLADFDDVVSASPLPSGLADAADERGIRIST